MPEDTLENEINAAHSKHRWLGSIEVSTQAIITVTGRSVSAIAGIVGVATRKLRYGAAELLPPERYNQGIDVQFSGDQMTVEVHVIVEHGMKIANLAYQAMDAVHHDLEEMLGVPVVRVYVIVQGLRTPSSQLAS